MLSVTPSDQLHAIMHVHVPRDVKFVFTCNIKKTDVVIFESFLFCHLVEGICLCSIHVLNEIKYRC